MVKEGFLGLLIDFTIIALFVLYESDQSKNGEGYFRTSTKKLELCITAAANDVVMQPLRIMSCWELLQIKLNK